MAKPEKGQEMNVTVEAFADVPQKSRQKIEAEAKTLAPFKGCTSAKVVFE
jgi:hypothetical protein